MRKLLLILFLIPGLLISQEYFDNELPIRGKVYYNWFYGLGPGITFNTEDKEPIFLEAGDNLGGAQNSTTLSTKNGKFLLHSYGPNLTNSNLNLLKNDMGGHSSQTNGTILIPLKNNKIVHITVRHTYGLTDPINLHDSTGLEYSIFTYDSLSEDITFEVFRKSLNGDYLSEAIGATYSFETNTYIIIGHDVRGEILAYEFDLEGNLLRQNSQPAPKALNRSNREIKINMMSDKVAFNSSAYNMSIRTTEEELVTEIYIYDFDATELTFSNKKVIKIDSLAISSFEFSENSKYLYFYGRDSYYYKTANFATESLYRYNLRNNKLDEIYSSESPRSEYYRKINNTVDKTTGLPQQFQIGPNYKIYIVRGWANHLTSIERPNSDIDPGYKLHTLEYPKYNDIQPYNSEDLPQMISASFADVFVKSNIKVCVGNDLQLLSKLMNEDPDAEYKWKGPNGFESDEQNPLIKNVTTKNSGVYYLQVITNGKVENAETYVEVFEFTEPEITTQPKDYKCVVQDSIKLTVNPEYKTYQWNTGDTTRSTTVYESGKYFVTVMDSNGCEGIAEIEVTFADDIAVNIQGPDSICYGEEAELICEEEFASYEWSTGDSTKSITVKEAGKYTLTVTTEDGCEASETFEVYYHPIVRAELKPAPISICIGDTVILESKYQSPDYKYLWNSEETTKSIEVTESGTYELVITDTKTGCQNSTEITINVEDELEPIIEGKNICGNETVTLTAIPNDDSYSYEWSTGETTASIEVSEPDVYSVTVTKDNCSGEAQFTVEQFLLPEFTIEGDTIVCEGETTTLTASKEFKEYLWSNGKTTRSITVGEGNYTLTVTDENGCTSSESVTVEEKNVELAFESMKYDFGKVYISENRDTTIEITNNSGEEVTAIINGDQVNIPEGNFIHSYTLDNSSMGAKQDFITIQVIEPCEAEYQIEITAVVYARVTLSTINIHTEIGETETVPYYLEAEADLGMQEFNITTDIERDLFFTNDSYEIPSPQAINQQRTQVHEQTGTILLAELYEYPITFPQVEFDNPYIEKDTIPGKITFDEICIHDLRLIHTYAPTEVSVAPNPARDVINIDITTGEDGNFTIELISTEGRTTYTDSWNQSGNNKNIQIDTRDISTGVYQLRLTTEGHIYRKEVVVVE